MTQLFKVIEENTHAHTREQTTIRKKINKLKKLTWVGSGNKYEVKKKFTAGDKKYKQFESKKTT